VAFGVGELDLEALAAGPTAPAALADRHPERLEVGSDGGELEV